jgi:hypothetical protein
MSSPNSQQNSEKAVADLLIQTGFNEVINITILASYGRSCIEAQSGGSVLKHPTWLP